MNEAPATLAIIGGGFAGTTLALQARAAWPEARILLFEPGEPGPGLAYGTRDPTHLLNVPATGMSLYPDQPNHFAEWLERQPDAPPPEEEGPRFAPRMLYGRYLREAFRAAEGPMLRHVPQQVTALEPRPEGGFLLRGGEGASHAAERVVLAAGGFAAEQGSPPHVFGNPWDPESLRGLGPDDPVLMVGLGLTMVDMLLSLRAQGHHGPVLGISRHGWLPLPHVTGAFPPPWPPRLPEGEVPGPLALARLLRREAARAAAEGQPWQAVADGLRPHLQRLWRGWDEAARRRFLRHGRSAWNLHRHRVAPAVGRFVAAEREAGRLEVMAARLESWRPEGEGVVATLRRRGGRPESRRFARIVLCTGPDGAAAWRNTPPVPSALSSGILAPDELGMGLAVEGEGRALGQDGKVRPSLFVLGPLTRGTSWEITAVPEIRAQAAALLKGMHGVGREA